MSVTEFACKVVSKRMLTPTVFEMGFETELPFSYKAGQFISVVIPGAGPKGRDLRRAYSIASAPEMRPVELCVKLVEEGPGTHYLYNLEVGASFKGFAPYGDFVYQQQQRPGRRAFFIATGTGVAPFRAMALSEHFKQHPPVSAKCILGVRTEDEILYDDTFRAVPGMDWVIAVSQPQGEWPKKESPQDYKGRVTDYIRALGDAFPWAETDFYLCGNGAMITEVKAILTEKGVTKDAIHQEKYY